MANYFFDTNIISYLASNKYPELSERVIETPADKRFINWVVQQELLYGVYRKNRIDLEIKYRKFFQNCNIIQSDSEIIETCSKIECYLDNHGLVTGLEDIWIGATCLAKDLILVTHNQKDFARIPNLKIEKWG